MFCIAFSIDKGSVSVNNLNVWEPRENLIGFIPPLPLQKKKTLAPGKLLPKSDVGKSA